MGWPKKNEIRQEDCVKKQIPVEDNVRKCRSNTNNQSPKIPFNAAIHAIKSENIYKTKNRFRKREKQKKEKRKIVEREVDYLQDYNDLLLDNLLKEYYTTKSPHLIISRKWFFKIKNHSIMLKKCHGCLEGDNRHVYYEIDEIGSKIRYVKKENDYVLNPSTTSRNTIFIVVRLADLRLIKKIQLHMQFGHMIQKYDLKVDKDRSYVMLSIIQVDKEMHKTDPLIFEGDLPIMKRFYINQVALKKGNYHYNTTGTIIGMGYGPKSNRNEFGHSVCKFANSKLSNFIIEDWCLILINSFLFRFKYPDIEKKKITTYETNRLNVIEDNIRCFTESSIDGLTKHFAPLRKSISPLVDKLQVHLDLFPEKKKGECKITEQGFMNYNLCLNAQTSKKHTECDPCMISL